MKKLILTSLAAATLAFSANTANAQLRIGPEVGLNISSMSVKAGGSSISTSSNTGARIGAVVDLGLTDHLYLQPGIFYSMEGTKYDGGSFKPNYLRIPINVLYKLGMPGDGRIFFGLAPTLGYCLGGKADNSGTSYTLKVGSDAQKDDIKGLDLSLGINAGYQLSMGLYARAAYYIGLSNNAPGGNSDNTLKNSSFVISVGWLFGGGGM